MQHRDIPSILSSWQRITLPVGIVGAIVCGLAWRNEQFLYCYLVSYLFWLGVAGGSLGLLCIHHLVAGRWGFMIQRPMEAAARTMPFMAILFLPIAFGLGDLYRGWMHPTGKLVEEVAHKAAFLNPNAFLIRAAVYFLAWSLIAILLGRWSRKVDATGDQTIVERMRTLSAPGLVVYGITASLASIDWIMSLEPDWWSTMNGPLFMVGQGLTTFTFMAILLHRISHQKPISGTVTHQQFHDIGNLIFAFTILWAYMNLGQFIIIWSGNVPEEDVFFLDRQTGGWPGVAWILALFHFAIPFFLLLNKPVKRHSRFLAEVAGLIIVMRFIDIYWLVTPTFHEAVSYHWLVFVMPFAVGGLWLTVFLQMLKRHPLLPERDARFVRPAAEHAGAGH